MQTLVCPECPGSSFQDASELRKHLVAEHEADRVYCPVCPGNDENGLPKKRFTRLQSLVEHLSKSHQVTCENSPLLGLLFATRPRLYLVSRVQLRLPVVFPEAKLTPLQALWDSHDRPSFCPGHLRRVQEAMTEAKSWKATPKQKAPRRPATPRPGPGAVPLKIRSLNVPCPSRAVMAPPPTVLYRPPPQSFPLPPPGGFLLPGAPRIPAPPAAASFLAISPPHLMSPPPSAPQSPAASPARSPGYDLNPQLTEAMAGLPEQPSPVRFLVSSDPGTMTVVSFRSQEGRHPESGQELHTAQVVVMMSQRGYCFLSLATLSKVEVRGLLRKAPTGGGQAPLTSEMGSSLPSAEAVATADRVLLYLGLRTSQMKSVKCYAFKSAKLPDVSRPASQRVVPRVEPGSSASSAPPAAVTQAPELDSYVYICGAILDYPANVRRLLVEGSWPNLMPASRDLAHASFTLEFRDEQWPPSNHSQASFEVLLAWDTYLTIVQAMGDLPEGVWPEVEFERLAQLWGFLQLNDHHDEGPSHHPSQKMHRARWGATKARVKRMKELGKSNPIEAERRCRGYRTDTPRPAHLARVLEKVRASNVPLCHLGYDRPSAAALSLASWGSYPAFPAGRRDFRGEHNQAPIILKPPRRQVPYPPVNLAALSPAAKRGIHIAAAISVAARDCPPGELPLLERGTVMQEHQYLALPECGAYPRPKDPDAANTFDERRSNHQSIKIELHGGRHDGYREAGILAESFIEADGRPPAQWEMLQRLGKAGVCLRRVIPRDPQTSSQVPGYSPSWREGEPTALTIILFC